MIYSVELRGRDMMASVPFPLSDLLVLAPWRYGSTPAKAIWVRWRRDSRIVNVWTVSCGSVKLIVLILALCGGLLGGAASVGNHRRSLGLIYHNEGVLLAWGTCH